MESREKRNAESGKLAKSHAALCWLSSLSFLLSASATAADKSNDAEHLLFLADHGLAVIQLQIEIGDISHRELCESSLQAICTDADRDHDGFLTAAEYDAQVAGHPVMQERQARVMQRLNASPERPEFGAAGRLSVSAVTTYLLQNVFPPLMLEFSSSPMRRISTSGEFLDRPLSDTQLFERLDTDGNRKLTSRELERAADVISPLDFDEDETISLEELRGQSPSNARPAGNVNRPVRRSDNHLSQLSPGRIDASLVRRILTRYDGEKANSAQDLRLDRQEVGMPAESFSKADVDRDGFWDFDELWRFLERPTPTVVITIGLASDTATETADFRSGDSSAAKLLEQRPGMIHFEVHGTRIQLLLPRTAPANQDPESQATRQFQSLDANNNAYLEPDEVPPAGDGERSQAIFQAIDSDGDGKIVLEEFRQFHRRSEQIRSSQLVLRVDNLERTLFGPLDVNADGRLSQRELAGLAAYLADWDVDRDGKLVEEEIPRQYRLTLSRGSGGLEGFNLSTFVSREDFQESSAGSAAATSPRWFRKMDRNRDGEVSAREFLGTVEQFEKADANSDGTIDAAEAATVK